MNALRSTTTCRTITDPRKRRSHQQRGADVIASMLTDGLLPATTAAEARGCVNLIIDIDQLAKPDGTAYTLDGTQIPASTARSMLCRAQINAWYQQADRTTRPGLLTSNTPHQHRNSPCAVRDGTCRWKHCDTRSLTL
ncbi:MAG: hypothetical protein R2770_04325 [Acidimicrobiales bacterium]